MKNMKKRNSYIDILKGICVIFVIISHYNWSNYQRNIMLFPFYVDMAVPIFMIISGYVASNSYENRDINTLSGMYCFKSILKKLVRYIIPFSFIYIIEVIIQALTKDYSLLYYIVDFFHGGKGPGSYYTPIMIQFVFVFPLIYALIKKYDIKGFFGCVTINVLFEFVQAIFNMPTSIYRLLIFRNIALIAFGCYLKVGNNKISKVIKITSLFLGVFWIILVKYMNYETRLINSDWAVTSYFSLLYIAPIYNAIYDKFNNIENKYLETIGKASFNIFLTQMIYFRFIESHFDNYVSNVLIINIINIFICILGGVLFYRFENKITSKCISLIDKYC